ncbi:hypothetical protein SAMN02745883_01949 [Caminicella sporogenes DSM 14501]|uniref:Uncharacterized protein n=1 Tax=Caminicella sporogenes DSM 14501 TaxID=1121266 RepID=A0A1M6S3B3_9FIRM|nr:hypothetical protein [Caminicella sporogenes]RKD27186.1 hypothetical protein BET04_09735 [Caminicella sporogenes]WIF95513.1 hypothetical protein QNI18_02470 [Caminicella sporogenes]SHK39354.1 hypothetical protein SAMN02745883_01949 [Caminicella sporogenes DSM 14501]
MKRYLKTILNYLFILLAFSAVILSTNYVMKTYACNEPAVKIKNSADYLTKEEKEELIEEAEFWGIPKELIRYMN